MGKFQSSNLRKKRVDRTAKNSHISKISNAKSLTESMDIISKRAQQRGFTPEILEEILHERLASGNKQELSGKDWQNIHDHLALARKNSS